MNHSAQIYQAKVMHKRLMPKINQFTYDAFYLALPLSKLNQDSLKSSLNIDCKGWISFFNQDHGKLDGSNLEQWIRALLIKYDLNDLVDEIVLFTMPRVLNYVFNPVSFWLCLDAQGGLRAVLCEVNNTFNQTHSYLCFYDDKREIKAGDQLSSEKVFYVSPFLEREGEYQFRFSLKKNHASFAVDFYNQQGEKTLVTTLSGKLSPLTKKGLKKSFFSHPMITFKAIYLIHWQAIKLFFKGIEYIAKPKQLEPKQTISQSPSKRKNVSAKS